MRALSLVSILMFVGGSAFADEIFIPISGSVGVFSTDMRLVNPSDAVITIQASYLPRNNVDNSAVGSKEVILQPRQMAVFDDVVASLFQAGDLGAIRLVSNAQFGATARIYAQSDDGTLGQFVTGVPLAGAMEKGILLQLESSTEFRTNVGMVNPDRTAPATVTMTLYNAADAVAATATVTLQPWGVVAPTNVAGLFPGATGDLSDAWISYVADKPVIVYGSVIDNGTTDPTYVPAIVDTGAPLPPPEEVVRTFDVSAFQWGYTFRENGAVVDQVVIEKDARVVLRFRSADVQHGFSMSPYVASITISPNSTREVEFIADQEGTFPFFCTFFCGDGHPTMGGSLRIGTGSASFRTVGPEATVTDTAGSMSCHAAASTE